MYDVRTSQVWLTGEDALFPGGFLSAGEAGVPGSFGGALCEVPAEAFFLGVDCP